MSLKLVPGGIVIVSDDGNMPEFADENLPVPVQEQGALLQVVWWLRHTPDTGHGSSLCAVFAPDDLLRGSQ